jgi:hypothetical protein
LQRLLKKALETPQTAWETLDRVYGWVQQIAEVLGEEDRRTDERQLRFLLIVLHMQEQASLLKPRWQQASAHFLKVTQSYAPHLFFC